MTVDITTGKPAKVDADTNGDRKADTFRQNDTAGATQRVDRDRNFDGKLDDRVFYSSKTFYSSKNNPEKAADQTPEVATHYERDDDYDGSFETKGSLDAEGNVTLDERDTTGDGQFDLRQHFTLGTKTREERDTRADQKFVVITHFEGGERVRQERDTTADGKIDSTLFFADGKQTLQERDTKADGKVDVWVTFDPKERHSK